MPARRLSLILLCLFTAIAAWNLFLGQGLGSDIGADPDEPAHAVTSLMIRDYLGGGFMQSPMEFAKRYYADFPKVALGHYPPVYYLVAGVALLVWTQPETLIVLQYLIAIAIACMTARLGRELLAIRLGPGNTSVPLPLQVAPGFFAGAITLTLPLMVKIQSLVMADLLLTLIVSLAVWAWVVFLQAPSAKRSLIFGVLATTAILTKGSGLLLGAVPVVSLVLLRRWSLLKDWRWWIAGVPVGLFAFPWMLVTAKITREGMVETPLSAFVREALTFYLEAIPASCGMFFTVCVVLGLIILIQKSWQRRLSDMEAVLLSLLIGGAAIMLGVPAGVSTRYLAPLVPALVIVAMLGCHRTVAFVLQKHAHLHSPLFGLACLILLSSVHQTLPTQEVHGFSTAVEKVMPANFPETQTHWLVSSDPRGEGGIIAEAAFRLPHRSPSPLRLHRAGKDLGTSDWLGRGYETAYKTEADILARLDELGITTAFLDASMPADRRPPHHELLAKALLSAPQRWQLIQKIPIARPFDVKGEMLIYQATRR